MEKQSLKDKIKETFYIESTIRLAQGRLFVEAEEEKLWDENESLRDFLGSVARKNATISTVNRRMNIYKAFCEIAGYSINDMGTIDDTRLNWMKKRFFSQARGENPKLLISKEILNDWVAKAKILSSSDFNIEKRQLDVSVPKDHTCQSIDLEEKKFWDCKVCKHRSWANPNG